MKEIFDLTVIQLGVILNSDKNKSEGYMSCNEMKLMAVILLSLSAFMYSHCNSLNNKPSKRLTQKEINKFLKLPYGKGPGYKIKRIDLKSFYDFNGFANLARITEVTGVSTHVSFELCNAQLNRFKVRVEIPESCNQECDELSYQLYEKNLVGEPVTSNYIPNQQNGIYTLRSINPPGVMYFDLKRLFIIKVEFSKYNQLGGVLFEENRIKRNIDDIIKGINLFIVNKPEFIKLQTSNIEKIKEKYRKKEPVVIIYGGRPRHGSFFVDDYVFNDIESMTEYLGRKYRGRTVSFISHYKLWGAALDYLRIIEKQGVVLDKFEIPSSSLIVGKWDMLPRLRNGKKYEAFVKDNFQATGANIGDKTKIRQKNNDGTEDIYYTYLPKEQSYIVGNRVYRHKKALKVALLKKYKGQTMSFISNYSMPNDQAYEMIRFLNESGIKLDSFFVPLKGNFDPARLTAFTDIMPDLFPDKYKARKFRELQ